MHSIFFYFVNALIYRCSWLGQAFGICPEKKKKLRIYIFSFALNYHFVEEQFQNVFCFSVEYYGKLLMYLS